MNKRRMDKEKDKEMNKADNKKNSQSKSKTKSKLKVKHSTKAKLPSGSKNKSVNSTKKLTRYQAWRLRAGEKIDERLKEESKNMIIIKFFIAPILIMVGILFIYLILDFETFKKVGLAMVVYFFPPAGKETVIPGGVAAGLNPLLIGLAIAFIDIVTGIFLLWNYDFAKLMPILGPWMERMEKRGGKRFKDRPWLEHLAFFGLVLFVMFPFQGSGGVGTTIVGRVIGMNKFKVFLAICIGAVVGCLLIAYFSDYFIEYFINDIYQGLLFLIIIAIILGIYNIFKYRKKEV